MFAELWKVADKSRKAMRPIDAMKAGVAAAKHADGKKVRNFEWEHTQSCSSPQSDLNRAVTENNLPNDCHNDHPGA